ncbi:MAG: GTP cyclohydrolase I FolE [Oscillospiraceae bacterium]|nr:GTP cyclohydrolase I FolE [Oscillospiraceae bacterium]
MKKEIDREAIERHIKGIITALGDNPEREGLKDTPQRVAKMYCEIFEGMQYTNEEIAAMFDKCFTEGFEGNPCGDIVVVKDIEVFSHCEHHLALMYDMKITVAYIPQNKVLGLSKIARIADMAARRLQLQERIGTDIAEIMSISAKTEDVAVFISANHSCMTARGIEKTTAKTVTSVLRGRFETDENMRNKLYFTIK